MKRIIVLLAAILILASCESQADVASRNVSTGADNFEVMRRVVFFNGITDTYLLTIEGLCSLGNHDPAKELSVTCKVGPNTFKKHFLGLSDNVSYFVEQMDPLTVDPWHYRVIFRPSTIVPSLEVR